MGFPEAATVLEDELALTREDPTAEGEQRFVTARVERPGQPPRRGLHLPGTRHHSHHLRVEGQPRPKVEI
ncbi:MAG TPA: BrnT family toxin [Thermoanaerobaculia bacterium]|nr:BrnT family toxin [Thermoanaerobaculia bacterium]